MNFIEDKMEDVNIINFTKKNPERKAMAMALIFYLGV